MENDRELLQLAAKAIDGFLIWHYSKQLGTTKYYMREQGKQFPWNPLEHDGDALRLAVRLKLTVYQWPDEVVVCNEKGTVNEAVKAGVDLLADTRYAIVLAASEVGKCNNAVNTA